MVCTFEICVHADLHCKIKSLHRGEKASSTCPLCNTDCQIEIGEFDSKIAVVMTRWVSLGPVLTTEDPLWKAHVYGPRERRARLDAEHLAHSPRLCFEGEAPESFEDLRSRNLSYLKDHHYKRVMPCIAELNLYTEPRAGLLQSLLGRPVRSRVSGKRARQDSPLSSSRLGWNLFPVDLPWDSWMSWKSIYEAACSLD